MRIRFLLPLLAVLLLPAHACAEIVGRTPEGDRIHAYPAPNGQTIYTIL